MKKITMKGKTVDEAVEAALGVLGGTKENAKIVVINEGKKGMLGVLGGEEAEVEVTVKTNTLDDGKEILQEILDKMGLMTAVDATSGEEGQIELNIKGEDLGRVIGKDGAALKSLEIIVSAILGRLYGQGVRVGVDAGEYKSRRIGALKRL
ncbi:MAG: Jag N-terminal domain-containing protein, partial [Candidatus Margulisbacteria bacterium]|nr:Jag N-terminal domain-containing protein [Candidatus Margulisiibacteriota bacterium]